MNYKEQEELLNSLSEEERKIALQILKEYGEEGSSETYDKLLYEDFEEVPVDIHTFLHDRRYLGNALYDADGRFTLYPYWEEKLKEIFPTNIDTAYNTLILTGSIGIGKSTVAVICQLYMLYRLLCLKDPYLYYGMQPIDKISISLMNITLENAKGVAYDKLMQMVLASEWFLAHGEVKGTTNLVYAPEKHIELITASSNNQIIGRCVITNFSDEVNWSIVRDPIKVKEKYMKLISQIDARMKSRFLRQRGDTTYLPTLNIIASSKDIEQAFLESYINLKKKNESKTTLIIDEPQWVVDSRKDSDIKFYVAIGNKFLANELVPLNATKQEIDLYRARGYSLLAVPIGYLENFKDNLDEAICSIAGISTASTMKYISGARWNESKIDEYVNPFSREILEIGTAPEDTAQYGDYFDLTKVPEEYFGKPMFVHLDMSKSGDATGICGVFIKEKKPKVEGEDSSKEMFYRVAFNVSIKAPRGYEISFDKNRQFIRWLRNNGFKVKGISADTYQAAQISQQLTADGFDVKTISMDVVDKKSHQNIPYAYFKSTLYDRRMEVYRSCDELTDEVLGLEREPDGSINHPENGKYGKKDMIDAVVGAMYNASQYADEYAYDYGETYDTMFELNEKKDNEDREQFVVNFEEELKRLKSPLTNTDIGSPQVGKGRVVGGLDKEEQERRRQEYLKRKQEEEENFMFHSGFDEDMVVF